MSQERLPGAAVGSHRRHMTQSGGRGAGCRRPIRVRLRCGGLLINVCDYTQNVTKNSCPHSPIAQVRSTPACGILCACLPHHHMHTHAHVAPPPGRPVCSLDAGVCVEEEVEGGPVHHAPVHHRAWQHVAGPVGWREGMQRGRTRRGTSTPAVRSLGSPVVTCLARGGPRWGARTDARACA